MYSIIKDIMSYKSYCKNNQVHSICLRVVGHRIRDGDKIGEIADRYSMHRNTVRNIMTLYERNASEELRKKIVS